LGELETWVRAEIIRLAHEAGRDWPDADRAELRRDALRMAAAMSLQKPEAQEILGTLRGISRVAFAMLSPCHPELAESDILNLLMDRRTLEEAVGAMQDVAAVHGWQSDPKAKPPAPAAMGPAAEAPTPTMPPAPTPSTPPSIGA
jgi:hypothetical protein